MRRWVLGVLLALFFLPVTACGVLWVLGTRPVPVQVADIPQKEGPQIRWAEPLPSPEVARSWLQALVAWEAPWGTVDVWVWGAPEEFRTLAPPEARILGAWRVRYPVGEEQTQVWLRLDARQDQWEALERTLKEAGWWEPSWVRLLYRLRARGEKGRGFVPSDPTYPLPLERFYCGPEGLVMEVRAFQVQEGKLHVTLDITRFPPDGPYRPPCTGKDLWNRLVSWVRQMPWGGPLPGVVKVPELRPPENARQREGTGIPWEQGWYFAYALLEGTEDALSYTQVLEHYGRQLQAQGWDLEVQEGQGQGAWSRWRRRSLLGRRWVLDLTVAQMDARRVTAWMVLHPHQAGRIWRPVSSSPMEVRIHGPLVPEGVQEWLTVWWMWRMDPRGERVFYPGSSLPAPPLTRPRTMGILGAMEWSWAEGSAMERLWMLQARGTREEVQEALVRQLRREGWQPQARIGPLDGGWMAASWMPERLWDMGEWCHPTRRLSLMVSVRPYGEDAWWVYLVQPALGVPRTCDALGPEDPSEGPTGLPVLYVPQDVPVAPGVPLTPVPWGSVWVPVEDEMRVLAAVHEQLNEQGWRLADQGVGGRLLWSRWTQGGRGTELQVLAWQVTEEDVLLLLQVHPPRPWDVFPPFPGD